MRRERDYLGLRPRSSREGPWGRSNKRSPQPSVAPAVSARGPVQASLSVSTDQNSPTLVRRAAFVCGESEISSDCVLALLGRVLGGYQQTQPATFGCSGCFGPWPRPSELVRFHRPKQPDACAPGCICLRRERDSNSRYPFGVHTLSRRASSATRASLRNRLAETGYKGRKKLWNCKIFSNTLHFPPTLSYPMPDNTAPRRYQFLCHYVLAQIILLGSANSSRPWQSLVRGRIVSFVHAVTVLPWQSLVPGVEVKCVIQSNLLKTLYAKSHRGFSLSH